MLHLALLNEILHCTRDVFDWNVGVNTMLIEQIDGIDLETLSDASATSLMCAGLLSNPACLPFSNLKPNFVAIATLPRNGSKASPTNSSLV